jgi:riboflavin synthase
MTRLLPEPGDRQKKFVGIFEWRISEVERRENHIKMIDRNHSLLPIALDCLKDKFAERPSAEELRKRIASLKQNDMYRECARICEEQKCETIRTIELLQQQHADKIEHLQQTIESQVVQLEKNDILIKTSDEAIEAGLQEYRKLEKKFQKEKKDEKKTTDTEISKLKSQLKHVTSEKKIAMTRVSRLESQLQKDNPMLVQQPETSNNEVKVKDNLKHREGRKEMCDIDNMAATVKGKFVYIMEGDEIYAYNTSTLAWYGFPGAGYSGCALAIVKNLLTLIGGRSYRETTNKLFSCTTERKNYASWAEEFPPMPTSRYGACALCTGAALIVAGGEGNADTDKLATIEVLNTATLQWSTAVDLPQQMFGGSLLQVGNDTIYMLGAYDRDHNPIKSVHTCSLEALLLSCNSHAPGERLVSSSLPDVWTRMTNIPAIDSAYVYFQGQLLAIGGRESDGKPISAIYTYCASTNSWKVVSHMIAPRRKPYATILPDTQVLIVVGGFISSSDIQTDTVETVTIVQNH